ncbi:MAG: hypothetical protein COB50_01330 [Thiotrichales bacterium]|nr:MAG: hypothetical protein COB50_01330 [Thiotrichales bacterium]
MSASLSLTALRADLYNIVDQVISTGTAVTIKRHGHIVRLVPEVLISKLDCLKRCPEIMVGNPEDFVHLDWSDEWKDGQI